MGVLVRVLAERRLGCKMRRPFDDPRAVLACDLLDAWTVGRDIDARDLGNLARRRQRPCNQRLAQNRGHVLAGKPGRTFAADEDGDDHRDVLGGIAPNSRTSSCASVSCPISFMCTRSTKSQRPSWHSAGFISMNRIPKRRHSAASSAAYHA